LRYYRYDNILTPISGATVVVRSDAGEAFRFIEDIDDPGVYMLTAQGTPGQQYHVEVTLPSGELITSEPTTILQPTPIDETYFNITADGEINNSGNFVTTENVNVFLNTSFEDTDRPYLRWRVEGVYEFQELYAGAFNPRKCYVQDNLDINNLKVVNTSDISGTELRDQPIFTTALNRRFNVIYCAHIRQLRISEDEFEYWTQVDELINIDGTLFDPPPASIQGNLQNESNPTKPVFGYFSVVSQSSTRMFIDVTTEGFFAESNCTTLSFRVNPPECSDCELINRSTLEKPAYWPF
ncbi:MAG: DUF4249 domain-containing protein, partial [Bacteroidota bacterium]